MRIGILAGEASGDLLGAKLIRTLKERCPDLQVEGIGGPAMMAAGCHSLFDIEILSVMGLVEPLLRLPKLIKLRKNIYQHFLANPPDVFIGVDAPDFNLGLEYKLRKAGIPTVHYVSPSVWAWRKKRIYKIAKAVNLMLTLFPFEVKFYEQHQVPVRHIGHPLAEQIPLKPDKIAARHALCINDDATYVALLPGSRRQEIQHLAEPFLQAAKLLFANNPKLRFLTTHVSGERYQEFLLIQKRIAPELPLHYFTRRSHDVMAAADAVIVTAGTATLETMLFKKPMVIAYRMSSFAYSLAKLIIRKLDTKFIGLPNVLANELLVPELIQNDVNPTLIAEYISDYLNSPEKVDNLQRKFTGLHQELFANTDNHIYDSIISIIKARK